MKNHNELIIKNLRYYTSLSTKETKIETLLTFYLTLGRLKEGWAWQCKPLIPNFLEDTCGQLTEFKACLVYQVRLRQLEELSGTCLNI